MSHKFADSDNDSDSDSDNESDVELTPYELKEKKHEKKQEKKRREEEEMLCPECDKLINDDGCDCRPVSCIVCGACNKIYSMEHILDKESDEYENACLYERLNGYYCYNCDPNESEEEEEERYSCDNKSDNDDVY
tara:strand:+ start:482 stop:886 length:405 start_codon:yes stop_codon:yes gene_type:complete